MNVWFAHPADLSDDPRWSALLDQLGPLRGLAAAGVLALLAGWCARKNELTIPAAQARTEASKSRLGRGLVERLLAALVATGLLLTTADGYALPDPSWIRRPQAMTAQTSAASSPTTAPRPATGNAARCHRRREKRKGLATAANDTPSDTGDKANPMSRDMGSDMGGMSADMGSDTGDMAPSPPDPPTPAQAQAHTQARENSPPPPAAPSEPTNARPVGGQGPESGVRLQQPPTTTALQRQRRLEAWGEGVAAITGQPWVSRPEEDRRNGDNLDRLCDAYAEGRQGPALKSWLIETAKAYVAANLGRDQYEAGFVPGSCLTWMRGGARPRQAPASGRRGGARPSPQPSSGRRWKEASFDDLDLNPELPLEADAAE